LTISDKKALKNSSKLLRGGVVAIIALIVSIIAIFLSGFDLLFTWRTNKREAEDWKFSREARPSAQYIGRAASSGHRAYQYRVRNVGGGGASDLRAELTNNRGEIVSEIPADDPEGLMAAGVFPPGDEWYKFEIGVREEFRRDNPLRLGFRWFDNRGGAQQKISGAKVPTN
jgi:hypothetical protein